MTTTCAQYRKSSFQFRFVRVTLKYHDYGHFILFKLYRMVWYTVNLEIFERILFSRTALKDIFAMLKIRD